MCVCVNIYVCMRLCECTYIFCKFKSKSSYRMTFSSIKENDVVTQKMIDLIKTFYFNFGRI